MIRVYAPSDPAVGKDQQAIALLLTGRHHNSLPVARGFARAFPDRPIWLHGDFDDAAPVQRFAEATPNAFVVVAPDFYLLHMEQVAVVVTSHVVPHRNHVTGRARPMLHVSSAASQLGIRVVELQHGLFQWGVSFHETSRRLSSAPGPGAGFSFPVQNFCDACLHWSGEDGIGYPPFEADVDRSPGGGHYHLVLSNAHWHLYGEDEARLCYDAIRRLAAAYPGERFIWKPHVAEPRRYPREFSDPRPADNLQIAMEHAGAAEPPPFRDTFDAIRNAASVVATPGTVLLDAEMFARPTLVYRAATLGPLADSLHRCETTGHASIVADFRKILDGSAAPLVTGSLQPFSPERLRARLEPHLRRETVAKMSVLPVVAPLLREESLRRQIEELGERIADLENRAAPPPRPVPGPAAPAGGLIGALRRALRGGPGP